MIIVARDLSLLLDILMQHVLRFAAKEQKSACWFKLRELIVIPADNSAAGARIASALALIFCRLNEPRRLKSSRL